MGGEKTPHLPPSGVPWRCVVYEISFFFFWLLLEKGLIKKKKKLCELFVWKSITLDNLKYADDTTLMA